MDMDRGRLDVIIIIKIIIMYVVEGGGGHLVASSQAYQLRVLRSSLSTGWPLSFVTTTKWPKITHMLP